MYAAYVEANAGRASHAIAIAASISADLMRPAVRAALAGAIGFTNAAGGLLLPAELDLPRALNIGELVE